MGGAVAVTNRSILGVTKQIIRTILSPRLGPLAIYHKSDRIDFPDPEGMEVISRRSSVANAAGVLLKNGHKRSRKSTDR